MRKTITLLAALLMLVGTVGIASADDAVGNDRTTPVAGGDVGVSSCTFVDLDDLNEASGYGLAKNWGQLAQDDRDSRRSIGLSPGSVCYLSLAESGGETGVLLVVIRGKDGRPLALAGQTRPAQGS